MAECHRRPPSPLTAASSVPAFAALHRAVHAVQQAVHESDLDVTHPEAVLLAFLCEHGEAAMTAIHRSFGFRRSTVTNVVDRLVDRGLAARHPDPADGRSWVVRLTPSGTRLSRRVLRVFSDVEAEVARILAAGD
jgi:DNA-binding MarR family transcriptional regulator